ncbi:GNAT family N-acetyltransferase [bacterium]|nr:GNAT family N-acetyltransferase [bacterium]
MSTKDVSLVKVHPGEMDFLREYVEALYAHDEDFDAMVFIEDGIKSLLRNEVLATAYFIRSGEDRIGYVILTRYHSVEKGGLNIFIDELYVEEPFRRGGVGAAVMAKITEIARQEGARSLSVQAEPYNKAAHSFFEGHGFQPNPNLNFERQL